MKALRPATLSQGYSLFLRPTRPIICRHHIRTFLPNPFQAAEPQSITASRTLPYPKAAIYDIISDISQYSTFLPYCKESVVTRYSNPDKDGKKWPEEATLVVGWGDIQESFQSRVYCVPGRIVESISGRSRTSLPREDIAHHRQDDRSEAGQNGLLTHLVSRWTLSPTNSPNSTSATNVNLAVEFQFANPLYSALSAAASPKLADIMIRAFEDRVRHLLGK